MLVQHDGIRGPVPKLTRLLVAGLGTLGCDVVTHPWGRQTDVESVPTKLWRTLKDVAAVQRRLRGVDFDIAVISTAHDWRAVLRDIAVAPVLRRRRRPVLLLFHGSRTRILARPGSRAFKFATAVLLSLADGVLVLSREEQRQIADFRPATRVLVVKNPYERKVFPALAERDRGGRAPTLLFVGRLLEQKGILDLVDAMPAVLGRAPCRLVIVGDGELERALRDRIRQLGLTTSVTLAGYLEGEELLRAYAAADVFVLPSWSEGFPTVLAEAMDAGLPIVTTRVQGAVDHLVEGEHALFVEPRDIEGLSSTLAAVVGDAGLRARMASANATRIDLFDPDVVAREYLEVLRVFVPAEGTQGVVDGGR
jgi:glycosyltransferase involved in cell wall biosynthesis